MVDSLTCPHCGYTSYNPHDITERYCGHCHIFLADQLSETRRDLEDEIRVLKSTLEAANINILWLDESRDRWKKRAELFRGAMKHYRLRLDSSTKAK